MLVRVSLWVSREDTSSSLLKKASILFCLEALSRSSANFCSSLSPYASKAIQVVLDMAWGLLYERFYQPCVALADVAREIPQALHPLGQLLTPLVYYGHVLQQDQ